MTDLASAPGAWLAQSGRTSLVVGIDPSLTCTGIVGDGWADALRPKGRGHQRLRWLREEVRDRTRVADLVVIEGAAYGRGGQAGRHELAGLWWTLALDLWERDIPYAVVNPHSRTIYATGSANPAKEYPKARARIAKGMERDAGAAWAARPPAGTTRPTCSSSQRWACTGRGGHWRRCRTCTAGRWWRCSGPNPPLRSHPPDLHKREEFS